MSVNEPLSLDALQLYRRLSDASDAETTAFLSGGLEPAAVRERYQADITAAGDALAATLARGGGGRGATGADLRTLTAGLTTYTQEIGWASADNRLGLPLGAAYLREATALLRGKLLPAAKNLYNAENAGMNATSARATGRVFGWAVLAVGAAAGVVLWLLNRWLYRRTNRIVNPGLAVAGLALAVSLAWLGVAQASGSGDLRTAYAQGARPAMALAQARIVAQQAHADESLTLIDDTGDDSYQADYGTQQRTLGPGPATLLAAARTAAAGTAAAGDAASAAADASGWETAHAAVRRADNAGQHSAAVRSVLGDGPGDAGGPYQRLSGDLTAGIVAGQAAFDDNARAGINAYAGLEPGLIALALIMAAAAGLGLRRRLAEYR
jgi:hypothetical protein